VSTVPIIPRMIGLLPRGTITLQLAGDAVPVKRVMQRVARGLGNIGKLNPRYDMQLRRYVKGTDPQTPAQLAWRAVFAAGVAGWRALSPAEKEEWNRRGRKRRMSGWNRYLSWYLEMHH